MTQDASIVERAGNYSVVARSVGNTLEACAGLLGGLTRQPGARSTAPA